MTEHILRKCMSAAVSAAAFLYLLVDFLFLSALRPVFRWLKRLRIYARTKAAIEKLGPYSTLALFLVPLIILEPFKPAGMYLIAKKQIALGIAVVTVGEILKIGIVEQIFQIGKPKLMTIPAFASVYGFVMGWLNRIKALPAVQVIIRQFRVMKHTVIAAIRRIKAGILRAMRWGRR